MKKNLKIYQLDAFADRIFSGNPAAVIPLEEWLPVSLMQSIALENQLSETVYFVKEGEGYRIRWFTPLTEVDLCGHATLAAAFVLFDILNYEKEFVSFESNSGNLKVFNNNKQLLLDFPVYGLKENSPENEDRWKFLFGNVPTAYLNSEDHILVFSSEEEVLNLKPDFEALKKETGGRGWIVTSLSSSKDYDYVYRFFGPALGINEDPATGSAQCALTPFWSDRLGKSKLKSKQLSSRKGYFTTELKDNRVLIGGKVVLYMKGELEVQI
ncbi:PhzF family phenazine biosynthesis protein [Leptospira ilyithenensis]|uniref:PhzF family phenazine biosynthesis protein n=1 Tax=Leptospira ilyithenensis TaxID=2484901 RepID=A0A4R9LVH3_9LEPT|nr:PhzF family phenazine biosynthesis protein [Leptospira ilyithenensis]TGN13433.1 PhzF family phenazine biosynthesis protein [Leptospira ilyithenensis]